MTDPSTTLQPADVVKAKLEQERADVVEQDAKARKALPRAQGQLDAADKAETKAWEKIGPYARVEDAPVKLQEALRVAQHNKDRALATLQGNLDTITFTSGKLKKLDSPEEFERRLATTTRLRALKEGTMPKKAPSPCECGCGTEVKGRFAPGHDAKLKSALIKIAIESADLTEVEKAEKDLQSRGWMKFLVRKREVIAEKVKKAEEKAQAARERVEAKKSGKSNGAKTTAEKSGTKDVKPDPKPAPKKRTSRSRAKK